MSIFTFMILGSILNLENMQIGQFLISRPSFTGFIAGLFFNIPLQGFAIGLLLEVIYLDYTPLGGAIPPNGVLSSFSFPLFYSLDKFLQGAFFAALLTGFLYSFVEKFLREYKNNWNLKAEIEIKEKKFKASKWILKSLIMDFITAFVFLFFIWKIFILSSPFIFKYEIIKETLKLSFLSFPFIAFSSLYFRLKGQIEKKN